MIRSLLALSLMVLTFSVSAQARDDGGFGSGFTNAAPSALSDTSPSSALAQKDPVTGEETAEDMQNIMPAAGDEESAPSDAETSPSAKSPCGDAVIVAPAE